MAEEEPVEVCPPHSAKAYDLTEGFGENDPVGCVESEVDAAPEPANNRIFIAVVYKRGWASWEDDDEVDSLACKRPKFF